MSGKFRATALSKEGGKTLPFPWRRETAGSALWFQHETKKPEVLRAAFIAPEGAATSPLGRGGFHYDHPALGPVRVKRHRRGGLIGLLFPEAGLDEARARSELKAEVALRFAGFLTQETLAARIAEDSPRLQSLQRYFPDEKTHAELQAAGELSAIQSDRAAALLRDLVAAGWWHRDANGGNLLWNAHEGRWRIIDLASARPCGASARALAMMHKRLAKPPRQYR